jgi:hypothetical protein
MVAIYIEMVIYVIWHNATESMVIELTAQPQTLLLSTEMRTLYHLF